MATTSGKCAHPGCNCSVQAGQTYCSPYCQQRHGGQQSQQGSRQQSQQGASGSSGCGCGHAACQHSG